MSTGPISRPVTRSGYRLLRPTGHMTTKMDP